MVVIKQDYLFKTDKLKYIKDRILICYAEYRRHHRRRNTGFIN